MRLDTPVSGQQLVSYDEKKFHGSWEWFLNRSGGSAYSINFNANPDKTVKPHMFFQIGTTGTYRHVGNAPEWNAMLIHLPDSSW